MKVTKKGCLKVFLAGAGVVVCFFLSALVFLVGIPMWGWGSYASRHGRPPITPAWALEPWVWEDDENTADFVWELLNGYREHDIPVRTILIDSPWSMRYNDYIVDEERYPEPEKFFLGLQEAGYRVVLWTTCAVNSQNPDTAVKDSADWHREAADKGYLVGGDFQTKWWKGRGGLIDYTNPEAMAWWRGMQQQVLDWGIDGWKLDGLATFMRTQFGPVPLPYAKAHAGWIKTRTYMDHYYRDEYLHGLAQNPEFVTMSRALDSVTPWAHPYGFAPVDASPVNWLGDNRHDWEEENRGLALAIRLSLESAALGYNVIGSDIGGYHGGKEIAPELYIRWAQFSVFTGLFLNGGHGERRLWKRTPQELEHIRTAHWLKTELVPYTYSHVVECHEGGPVLMRPTDGELHYLFGDAFLVAPIYENSEYRAVHLPEGQWRYWHDDAALLQGPTLVQRTFSLQEYPVYVREGAVIPMNIERDYTGIGERDWAGHVVWNCYPSGRSEFTLHHPDGNGTTTLEVDAGAGRTVFRFSGRQTPHILRVFSEAVPQSVELDGAVLPQGDKWTHDAAKKRLVVRNDGYETGEYVVRF